MTHIVTCTPRVRLADSLRLFGRGSRLTAAAMAALLLAAGCSRESEDPALAQGRELYEANCLSCHGEGALGDGAMASSLPVAAPSLLEHLGHHSRAQLTQLIRDGVPPAMPPTPLADEEIQLIVDYVWTLVPESEVAELRAMQQHAEMMADSGGAATMQGMPGMSGMPGMDTASQMSPAQAPGAHTGHGAGAAAAGQ